MSGCSSQSVARWVAMGLLGVLVACSGGSGGSERGGSANTTAAPTTAPPATIDLSKPIPGGSLHGTPRPPLENTGTDYVAIFRSLIANQRWISENPDPALISDVYVPGTPGHDARVQAYQYLVDNGYRWADEGFQLLSVDVIDAKADIVSLRVTDGLEFERVVDAAGNQVGNTRPRNPATQDRTTVLSRDGTGRWRIADVSPSGGGTVQL
jgi:hypothetical protein